MTQGEGGEGGAPWEGGDSVHQLWWQLLCTRVLLVHTPQPPDWPGAQGGLEGRGGKERGRWEEGPIPVGVEPPVHLYILRDGGVGVGIQT